MGLELNYRPDEEIQAITAQQTERVGHLDLTNTQLVVDIPNIDQLPNDEYALLRKNGLGASDSSIILGVNPYKSADQLVKEKATPGLSEEEKAVSNLVAVKKGVDLEPLIVTKFEKFFKMPTIKPVDMYRFKDYPYLKINFDGVTGTPEQYEPCEIKVVTKAGEKHYDPTKAMYAEGIGWLPLPEDITKTNNSIITKAAYYGIPPYYYTQVQMQMMGLNADHGFLSVLFEASWTFYSFYIHRDQAVWNALIIEGYKLWERIEKAKLTGVPNPDAIEEAAINYMKKHHVSYEMAHNAVLNGLT